MSLWNLISGVTSYNTYWAPAQGVSKATSYRIVDAVSPFAHTGLTSSTTYFYVVTAGVGGFSSYLLPGQHQAGLWCDASGPIHSVLQVPQG